jgi:hypothetical protein
LKKTCPLEKQCVTPIAGMKTRCGVEVFSPLKKIKNPLKYIFFYMNEPLKINFLPTPKKINFLKFLDTNLKIQVTPIHLDDFSIRND